MLPPAAPRRAPRGAAALWGAPRRPAAAAAAAAPPRRPPAPPLDFGAGAALGARSGRELARALLVLRLCAVPAVGRHAETLLRVSRRLLGARLWGAALRGSFYGHFVGGETPAQLQGTADRLRVLGLRPLLALPTEDEGQHGGEPWFEANGRAALACVGLAAGTGPRAMMQLKVTALLSARLCETLSQRAEEPGSELSVERVMAALGGEAPAFSCLSPADNAQLGAALQRLERVAAHAASRGVRLLLDAEQSELRAALTLLGLALMGRHNRAAPWVWHTQQAYLRDAVGDLGAVLSRAQRLGACVGLKLVRGAYLQHERGRGAALPSRQHTDRSYGQCLELALARAARAGGRLELMVATHNEGSVQLAARRMEELGVPRDGAVCFGQLLGMCDHVSLALGRAGFVVYKSVPFGPAEAVLPYLARRAQENRAMLEGGRRERELLARELRRRLLPWAAR